jgi:hypothetical protein
VKLKTPKGSKITARIKAAADLQLGAHVKPSVIFGCRRWYILCAACGGRWSVSERDSSARRPEFYVIVNGDDYCENGATNYFNAEGNVTERF